MSDLLPCPFCGGEAVKVDGFTVACAHGLCIGWTVRRASPHEWNRRALPAVQPDLEVALRELAEGLLSLADNLTYIADATEANLHSEAYAMRADVLALIDKPAHVTETPKS